VTGALRTVLIVEDDDDICATMAELLRGEGYNVVCARDGHSGIAHLRTAEQLPGVILLDMMMPNMDGAEFRAAQQGDPRLAAVPVLLMTAGHDITSFATELRADGYLRKPFKDIETILDAVAKFFP
jgi:CheY-like chemotaxis protein